MPQMFYINKVTDLPKVREAPKTTDFYTGSKNHGLLEKELSKHV